MPASRATLMIRVVQGDHARARTSQQRVLAPLPICLLLPRSLHRERVTWCIMQSPYVLRAFLNTSPFPPKPSQRLVCAVSCVSLMRAECASVQARDRLAAAAYRARDHVGPSGPPWQL